MTCPINKDPISTHLSAPAGFHPFAYIGSIFRRAFYSTPSADKVENPIEITYAPLPRTSSPESISSNSSSLHNDWIEVVPLSKVSIQDSLLEERLNTWLTTDTSSSFEKKERAIQIIKEFINNEQCTILDLSGLELHTLPKIFFHVSFKRLKLLNLSQNLLEELSSTLKSLKDCDPLKIIIEANKLDILPNTLYTPEIQSLLSAAIKTAPAELIQTPTLITITPTKTTLEENTLIFLIDTLTEQHEFEKALELTQVLDCPDFKLTKSEEIKTKYQNTLPHLIDELIETKQSQQAIDLTKNLENPEIKLTSEEIKTKYQDTLPHLIDELIETKQFQQAIDLTKDLENPEMKSKKLTQINQSSENALINLIYELINDRNFTAAIAMVDALENPDLRLQKLNELDTAIRLLNQSFENDIFETSEPTTPAPIYLNTNPQSLRFLEPQDIKMLEALLANPDLENSSKIDTINYFKTALMNKKAFNPSKISHNTSKKTPLADVLHTFTTTLIKYGYLTEAQDFVRSIEDPLIQSRLFLRIADALIKEDELEEAIKTLTATSNPTLKSMRLVAIADKFMQKNQPEQALETLHNASNDYPYKAQILIELANIFMKKGQSEKALEALQNVPDEECYVIQASEIKEALLKQFRLSLLNPMSKLSRDVLLRINPKFREQIAIEIASTELLSLSEQKKLQVQLRKEIESAEDRAQAFAQQTLINIEEQRNSSPINTPPTPSPVKTPELAAATTLEYYQTMYQNLVQSPTKSELDNFHLALLKPITKLSEQVYNHLGQTFRNQLSQAILSDTLPNPSEQRALKVKLPKEIDFATDRAGNLF